MALFLAIGLYLCLIACNAPKVDAKSKLTSTDTVATIPQQVEIVKETPPQQLIIGIFQGVNDEGDYTFVSINDTNGVAQNFICDVASIVGHGSDYVGKKVKGSWINKKIVEAGSGDSIDARILEMVDTVLIENE